MTLCQGHSANGNFGDYTHTYRNAKKGFWGFYGDIFMAEDDQAR